MITYPVIPPMFGSNKYNEIANPVKIPKETTKNLITLFIKSK
jgi:hypothetical protein